MRISSSGSIFGISIGTTGVADGVVGCTTVHAVADFGVAAAGAGAEVIVREGSS